MLDRYTVLSERVILMSTGTTATPYSSAMDSRQVAAGVTVLDVEFGYRVPVRIVEALEAAADLPGACFTAAGANAATCVVSVETAVRSRNAHSQLPSGQTIIIGREVSLE